MLRQAHPGLLYGAIAMVCFVLGVAIEPWIEPRAEAGIPVAAGKLLGRHQNALNSGSAHKDAITSEIAATASVSLDDADAAAEPAIDTDPPPSTATGTDPEQNVDYFEMKNQLPQEGEATADSEPAREVDMIDEPGLPVLDAPDPSATEASPDQPAADAGAN